MKKAQQKKPAKAAKPTKKATRRATAKPRRKGRPKAGEPDWRPLFIEHLSKNGNVTTAAEAAGVNRVTAYKARLTEPALRLLWEDAIEGASDRLEAEAWRRAVDGIKKPLLHAGKVVIHVQEYSDALLHTLLKAHRPKKYREGTPAVANFDPTKLTDEQLQRIVNGENPLVVLASGRDA